MRWRGIDRSDQPAVNVHGAGEALQTVIGITTSLPFQRAADGHLGPIRMLRYPGHESDDEGRDEDIHDARRCHMGVLPSTGEKSLHKAATDSAGGMSAA